MLSSSTGLPPFTIEVTTIADAEDIIAAFEQVSRADLAEFDPLNPLTRAAPSQVIVRFESGQEALIKFLQLTAWEPGPLLAPLFQEHTYIPEFGSSPISWTKLGAAIAAASSTAIIYGGFDPAALLFVLGGASGIVIIVRVLFPIAGALGDGIGGWIRKRLPPG